MRRRQRSFDQHLHLFEGPVAANGLGGFDRAAQRRRIDVAGVTGIGVEDVRRGLAFQQAGQLILRPPVAIALPVKPDPAR